MKKENSFKKAGRITEVDVARVLGFDDEYIEELKNERQKKNETLAFDFESQFQSPAEYYKAQMLFKLVNDEIRLADLHFKYEDLQQVTEFCDIYQVEIIGYDVKKHIPVGDETLSDEEVSTFIKEKLHIDCDGRVFCYEIEDRTNEFFQTITCSCKKDGSGEWVILPGEKFEEELSNEDMYSHLIAPEEESNTGYDINIEGNNMSLSKSRVEVCTIPFDEWEYMDYLPKPEDAADNQWVLNNQEIRSHQENKYKIFPILRVSLENLENILDIDYSRLKDIREFDFLLPSDLTLFYSKAGDVIIPNGICLHCKTEEFQSHARGFSCKSCGKENYLHTNENFPIDDATFEEVQKFEEELTETKFNKPI